MTPASVQKLFSCNASDALRCR